MKATPLIKLIAAALFVGPLLGGCSSSNFDPTDLTDKLDFFHLSEEKKLKGERKPVFPEGVPGVSQGIPSDLVKGYKPPETAAVVEEPQEEKPKPKPRVVHRAAPKPKSAPTPTRVQVSPASQQAQQKQQAPAWPQPQPQPQQQQQSGAQAPWPTPQKQQQTSPWPDAPAPNTFQR